MGNKVLGHIINPATGRVAEVRQKSNGRKLPYLYTGKAAYQGSSEEREHWLANLKEAGSFGVNVGELPEGLNSPQKQQKQAVEGEWTPDETCLPDGEPEDEQKAQSKTAESAENQPKTSGVAKVFFGLLALGLAFGGGVAIKNNMGAN